MAESILQDDIRLHIFFYYTLNQIKPITLLLLSYSGPEKIRVQRCLLSLASGDIVKLEHLVDSANRDYRDIIFAAEYDGEENRLRNFNEPFVYER